MRKFSYIVKSNYTFKPVLHTLFIIPAICLSLSGCGSMHNDPSSQNTDQQFDDYTAELFTETVIGNTLTLHYTLAYPENWNINDYPLTLGSVSTPDEISATAANENILAALESFPDSELSTSRQMNKEILTDTLLTENQNLQFPFYEEPLSPTGGLQTELPILLAEYTFYDEQDISDYLSLLTTLPDCFSQAAQYEKAKSEAGLFMPSFASDAVIAQCQAMTAEADSHFLIQTFDSRLKELNLSEKKQAAYQEENQEIIEGTVLPAFTQLANELLELQGSEKNEAGLCLFPLGKEYYEYLVYQSTGSSKTVTELAQAIEQRRLQDLAEASLLLAENSQLSDQVLAAVPIIPEQTTASPFDSSSDAQTENSIEQAEVMLNQLQQSVCGDFPALTNELNVTVKEVAPSLRNFLSPAFYLTVPIDADTENVIYLNDDAEQDPLTLFTTLAHEGYPGHLLQTVYFNRHETCMMRHLLSYPGYIEGWATYAELTSFQYTGLDENLIRFFQLEKSVILSLYCSADIGIHYEGWDLKQTKTFFKDYGIEADDAIKEVYEYIIETPANYLKYYGGYLEIEELKAAAIQKYGDTFSITAFHQALLTMGPAPFSILEKYFQTYYEAALSDGDYR